ncbi:MAG: cyanophycin synthetase, partial [Candidatus Omnitrophota bacterium]|nr:cyanophycin synthetase [Candidatus Omnitrophota bacterium]
GRLNLIEYGSVRFIDDTYNSNPFSLEQALRAFSAIRVKGRKIFVMGDMLELGSRQDLFHRRAQVAIARSCDALIGVGRLSTEAAAKVRKSGSARADMFTCDNAAQARDILFNRICAGPDDIVLVKGSRSMKMEEIFR